MAIIGQSTPQQTIEKDTNFTGFNTMLAAINNCLSAMGRVGVPTSDSNNIDARMAVAEVERQNFKIQSNGEKGWWFNREYNWEFTPDDNGYIYLPNNTLSMLAARIGNKVTRNLVIRNKRLYDTEKHTYDLRVRFGTEAINFDLIVILPFIELPPTAQIAISYAAAAAYAGKQEFDQGREQAVNYPEAARTMMQLEQAEVHNSQNNYWEQNGTMLEFESGINDPLGSNYFV